LVCSLNEIFFTRCNLWISIRPVVVIFAVVIVVSFVVVVFVFVGQIEISFTRCNLWRSMRPVVVVVIVVAFVVVVFVFVFVEKSKSCSLDVIFDAPRILLHLRKREAAKLAPNRLQVVVEGEVGSQLLRSLVAFFVSRHRIEEEVKVWFR